MDYIDTGDSCELSNSIKDARCPKEYDYLPPTRSDSGVSTSNSVSDSISSSKQSDSLSSETSIFHTSSVSSLKHLNSLTKDGHESVLPTGSNAGIDFMTSLIEQYQKAETQPMSLVHTNRSHSVPNRQMTHQLPVDPAENTENYITSFSVVSPKTFKSSSALGSMKKKRCTHKRKAHSKIERKYRININSKIARLQKLVPWMCDDDISFQVAPDGNIKLPHLKREARKLNKSMILDIVTRYIIHLKEENKMLHSKILSYESNVI